MATYHHSIKSGKKGTASSHAAYITRQGKHRTKEDLVLAGHGNMPDWSKNNPARFWQAGDRHERANGAVYREHEIALPNELSVEQIVGLVPDIVQTFAGGKPHQYGLHAPLSSIENQTNMHIHLMISDRMPDGIERSPEQTFARFNAKYPERGGCRKDSGGKSPREVSEQMMRTRKASADLINAALEKHGHAARVDHRSLKEREIARAPERHLGPTRIHAMTAEEKAQFALKRKKTRN